MALGKSVARTMESRLTLSEFKTNWLEQNKNLMINVFTFVAYPENPAVNTWSEHKKSGYISMKSFIIAVN